MVKKILVAVSISLLLPGCEQKSPPNYFADPVLRTIGDLQDRRLSDSLFRYFSSPDPRYRAAAALAFASIQDTSASMSLGNLLLEDTSVLVRENAAFALGQTGGVAAVNALIPAANDANPGVVREVLEALGKTVAGDDIRILNNYATKDTLIQEGLAWGFYRMALRNKTDTTMVVRQNEFLGSSYTFQTRLAAAHFFNQSAVLGGRFETNLINAALHDRSAEVRIAATAGLRKLKDDNTLSVLRQVLQSDADYRVRISATRSLQVFPIEKAWDLLLLALHDRQQTVAIAASEIVPIMVKASDPNLLREARSAKNARVKANLFKAIFAAGPYSPALVEEVKESCRQSKDEYERAQWIGSLSGVAEACNFIADALIQDSAFVVRTSAALALAEINHHKAFTNALKMQLAERYRQAVIIGDPAVISIVSETLSEPSLGYRKIIRDYSFLREARKKLQLPRDIESLQPLDNAIAYFDGNEKPAPLKNSYNHPIDWQTVSEIGQDRLVLVKTTRGDIVLRLLPQEAPGSVANFVSLLKAHYFDGRFFHRVVPNFVIQTGCKRGDGFGSEDFSIRSEFTRRRYQAGSVGMASAGKDTEGTQWFITHSPTPHLGGRYTIFAEVVEGMTVVDQIEVGDRSISITLMDVNR